MLPQLSAFQSMPHSNVVLNQMFCNQEVGKKVFRLKSLSLTYWKECKITLFPRQASEGQYTWHDWLWLLVRAKANCKVNYFVAVLTKLFRRKKWMASVKWNTSLSFMRMRGLMKSDQSWSRFSKVWCRPCPKTCWNQWWRQKLPQAH